jgi:hypothetical protein
MEIRWENSGVISVKVSSYSSVTVTLNTIARNYRLMTIFTTLAVLCSYKRHTEQHKIYNN